MTSRIEGGTRLTALERFQALSQHRRQHSERVQAVMEELATAHHLNLQEARLAGWGHDLARELSRPQLLAEARRLGLAWGAEEEGEPVLLHGPIAAEWLRLEHLGSDSVWTAIRCHTTGGPVLDALGQALFVADGVEPARSYSERESLYKLSLADLAQGYAAVLRQTLLYLNHRGLKPHPNMLQALAALGRPD